jgi:ribose 5-phosphate isomerase A
MSATTHDELARRAVASITSGMMVGLGTGRAATRAIHALAARVNAEKLRIDCVATSIASHNLAEQLGLTVHPMQSVSSVDFLFDGADEVDPQLRMVKGRGGAMTREKIVAAAVKPVPGQVRRLYLIDDSKLVQRLGEKMPLPIEVMPFALASATKRLADLGLTGPIRQKDGKDYLTDNNNLVIDAALPPTRAPEAFASSLDEMEGIIDHGFFLVEADEVLTEDSNGTVRSMKR